MLMPVFKRWHWHIFYIHRCRPCSSFKQCFDFDQSIDTKITNGLYFWKILKNLVCIWSVFWEKVVCIWSVIQTFFFYRPLLQMLETWDFSKLYLPILSKILLFHFFECLIFWHFLANWWKILVVLAKLAKMLKWWKI